MAKTSKLSSDSKLYCTNCGQLGIPVWRKGCLKKGKFHRKKMWCYHCKVEVNFVECRTKEEEEEFMERFKGGEFKDESVKSIEHCKPRVL